MPPRVSLPYGYASLIYPASPSQAHRLLLRASPWEPIPTPTLLCLSPHPHNCYRNCQCDC